MNSPVSREQAADAQHDDLPFGALECAPLRPGEMTTVTYEGTPIVVSRSQEGEYHAIRGICPHQGAPLGGGKLTWLTRSESVGEYDVERDGEILQCPWHSFEFDVATGRCIASPRLRVKTYPVTVHHDRIQVHA